MEHVLGAPPRGRSRLLSLYTPTGDPQTRCEWSIHTKIIVFTQGLHLFGARPRVSPIILPFRSHQSRIILLPIAPHTLTNKDGLPDEVIQKGESRNFSLLRDLISKPLSVLTD